MNDEKLRPYIAGPLYHHEALDGSGYPNGLSKKDIPYEGQIIRVADEYDAIVSKRQYKSHIGISDTVKILIENSKSTNSSDNVKESSSLGKNNPIIVKTLMKVIIDDIEYEISCTLDYLKDVKNDIKRLEQIDKYAKKMKNAKDDKTKNYYLEGMKQLLTTKETVDNYTEFLNSYKNILQEKQDNIQHLFEEIKIIKKLKI